jgi:rhodanese-related sulfurtransferase/ABC-type phosphate/phosphonate transport system substrate-binding protein
MNHRLCGMPHTPIARTLLMTVVCACATLVAPATGFAQSKNFNVLINPGDQGEKPRFAVYVAWKKLIAQALGSGETTIVQSTDATADLSATRARTYDVMVGPAHVIGSALRYGYLPVVGIDKQIQAVLVAPATSTIKNLADAKGTRLGLPLQDSVATYLMRGEVNAINSSIKRHFSEHVETRYQDALLICLQMRKCDVVVVERSVFDRWQLAGEKVKMIMQSKPVPSLSVAVKPGVNISAEALQQTLRGDSATQLGGTSNAILQTLNRQEFDYVSTLGYFTPRMLSGATVVDAPAVAQLMQTGAKLYDTRNQAEYKAGHIAGAKLLPYHEKSAKDADFKPTEDQFDVSQLPANKADPVVFACNGAECWKSFKASHVAIKAGYTKVYWFRGGFPEWRDKGQKIETTP